MKQTYYALALFLGLAQGSLANAETALLDCGNDPSIADHQVNNFNDQSEAAKQHIYLVEKFHFLPSYRDLSEPNPKNIAENLNYVLRHVPNHPFALDALSRLHKKLGGRLPILNEIGFWTSSIDCYFQRALVYSPNDSRVHQVYALHFHRNKKLDLALEQYEAAQKISPDDSELHYNLGILYFDMQRLDDSLKQAKRAYELGYPLPGLREKLKRAKKWETSQVQQQ